MARPKRTPGQLELTRTMIASMYAKGQSMAFMAAEIERQFGVQLSLVQIGYDIQHIIAGWRKQATGDIERAKGLELGKLVTLELEYWDAWKRSCQPREITRTAKTDGERATTSASFRKEQRDGNPAFLQGVMSCIERRCKILGIDAPVKINVEDVTRQMARDMGFDQGQEEKAVAEVERYLRAGR